MHWCAIYNETHVFKMFLNLILYFIESYTLVVIYYETHLCVLTHIHGTFLRKTSYGEYLLKLIISGKYVRGFLQAYISKRINFICG